MLQWVDGLVVVCHASELEGCKSSLSSDTVPTGNDLVIVYHASEIKGCESSLSSDDCTNG